MHEDTHGHDTPAAGHGTPGHSTSSDHGHKDHDHGHKDHDHGHKDHAHGGGHGGGHGGHGGHDDHGHHEFSWVSHLLFALVPIVCLSAMVGLVSWLLGGSNAMVTGVPRGAENVPLAAVALTVLPLLAFATQMLIGRYLPRKGDWVSVSAILIAGGLATWIFFTVLSLLDQGQGAIHAQINWFTFGKEHFTFGVYIDSLTACMLFIVTFIGGMVHLYSTGYLSGDPRYGRFFGYLSIFCFSMLGLVLSDNIFGLYMFWELVGLSSYLLIGFWFEKPSAADACKKAFLTNRVGDIGFFFGLALIYTWTGTLSLFSDPGMHNGVFDKLAILTRDTAFTSYTFLGVHYLTWAGVLVFCGAIGKSAQFPLHVWLPDAMEGPTPVSALIHAATMVAAGVYMVARVYPIFTPGAFYVIAATGLFTACFAGTIAIAQNDIKRVLAYSTVSQLGYMVMALGLGGYTAGLFHLSTHAFFKALLFLCSGAVIHSVHTQDMREMGGLWKKIPLTFTAMTIGTLAICGIPGFSGHYSKDSILELAYEFGQKAPPYPGILWTLVQKSFFWLAVLAAGITAFYSFRLIIMTFLGEPRDRHRYDAAHESPTVMTAPLIILSVFAVCAGWGFTDTEAQVAPKGWLAPRVESGLMKGRIHAAVTWGNWYKALVQPPALPQVELFNSQGHVWPGTPETEAHGASHEAHSAEHTSEHKAEEKSEAVAKTAHKAGHHEEPSKVPGFITNCFVAAGTLLSFLVFYFELFTIAGIEAVIPPAGRALRKTVWVLENKYFIDELYGRALIAPFMAFTRFQSWFDRTVIDGIVNSSASVTVFLSVRSGECDQRVVDGFVNWLADFVTDLGDRLRSFESGRVQQYLVHTFWVVVLTILGIQLFGGM